ncbi:hypothetical protein I5677_02680 [Mobilitalea sibirica]|uniref:DNA mismatch repair proteins mutS family domain-containing protein n=1 Tax=Mobilitalea sibirica TaxID=1462919 RepID=A0A8J7KZA6_9FIRM|nr:hypothetical protein [Mobilitalea sibirica]MBH1939798.1 hypothetical protein [Mobilitalea sibirica]
MVFQSILGYHKLSEIEPDKVRMPKYFYDLNLDQIVQDILDEQKVYDLRRFYFFGAERENDINYRLSVLKDMDNETIFKSVNNFCIIMRKSKEYLNNINHTDHDIQKQKWNLDAAFAYINNVVTLHKELEQIKFISEGFQLFHQWLTSYINSEEFLLLQKETRQLINQFEEMKFHIQIKRDKIIINEGYLEDDYCKQLQDTFREESEQKHFYQNNPFSSVMLSALETAILDVLKKNYKHTFEALDFYDKTHHDFIHPILETFELEVQFYIAFCSYRNKMLEMNFHFCYPQLHKDGYLNITEGYDLALAKKNALLKKEVIFNDCYFNPGEQFYVITGPNQGGKTTFARALGQIVFFTSLGLMVPSRSATLPFFDGIYTHFAVEENMDTGAGKLKEELLRLRELMGSASNNSFIIINEIFTSATSYDAHIMGRKALNYFMDRNCFGIYVTHIYELTKNDERIVSLVASLLSKDSNIRTFKIARRPADGKSYANTIVEKHHMTYREIKERIKRCM